ncbi:hypothetical protein M422DRAFT_263521 [Sphaerobolus stellatus SS14]|uniref:Uncharacterized protein n=1 Tax=Sphaerobolus stellatus (strain SS14) TaxID=990650 RepID=A0A0C9TVP1_SPHS4|nr:hypothetical protein M422DRAFT_263521 [Sphaerobolus stellatus SS14]
MSVGWQEFEMEAWFPEYGCSVVVARAFTNSQSGKAHFILFERIFDVMKQDTGIENVRAAMMSLASAEPLAELPGTLDLIQRQGGKKGNDWLNDKLAAEGFALAGICRQRSLNPVESWKAAPNTTNGNEQAHRDANRNGVHLSLFAGIMRILQYDSRKKKLINITTQTDIPVCDNHSTDFE